MNEQQITEAGTDLGHPGSLLKWAHANQKLSYPLLQEIADHQAMMSGSCSTPRPKPKFTPGYWECVGGSWLWVAGV